VVWRLLGLGVALGLGFGSGCLTKLERGVSCGDGWRDPMFEECDPRDPDESYKDQCRERFDLNVDAICDPVECTVLASEDDCSVCGDGRRSGDEACDGSDVPAEATCVGSKGPLTCLPDCTLNFEDCPAQCGDGLVTGTEECEPSLGCKDDDECEEGKVCSELLHDCVVAGDGFAPNLACGFYDSISTLVGDDNFYTSGTISQCTNACFFGRNDCGYCGNGVREPEYTDFIWPGAAGVIFEAEICDGDERDLEALADHCRPLCVDDPGSVDPNLPVYCDYKCSETCDGFELPGDIAPGDMTPEALGCCLAPGTLCPTDNENVPQLKCCHWLNNPDIEENCVYSATPPLALVCPG